MKVFLIALLIVSSGCATGKGLVESSVLINSDLELNFVEYYYTKAEVDKCEKERDSCLKNGVPAFGLGSSVPQSYLSELILKYKDKSYKLDTLNMYNTAADKGLGAEGVVEHFYANCYDVNNCIVRGIFSDAGGSFVAEWYVIGGVPTRTMLTFSGDIVQKFIANINPPIYE